jgi:hypothetical protein
LGEGSDEKSFGYNVNRERIFNNYADLRGGDSLTTMFGEELWRNSNFEDPVRDKKEVKNLGNHTKWKESLLMASGEGEEVKRFSGGGARMVRTVNRCLGIVVVG